MTQEASSQMGMDERLAAEAESALDACCQPVSSVLTVPPPQVTSPEAPLSPSQSTSCVPDAQSPLASVADRTHDGTAWAAALAWLAAPIDLIPPRRRFVVDWIAWTLLAWTPIVWTMAIMG